MTGHPAAAFFSFCWPCSSPSLLWRTREGCSKSIQTDQADPSLGVRGAASVAYPSDSHPQLQKLVERKDPWKVTFPTLAGSLSGSELAGEDTG